MNHKQLLALFLCFVMILSSKIVSIEENKVVSVKNVSNNIDKYTIENIKDETDEYSIKIFYPMTKSTNVNDKIKEKINNYVEKFNNENTIANKKELTISFEEFEYKDYTSFKFNVKSNTGTVHDLEESFSIVYKDDEIIDVNYLNSISKDIIERLYEQCKIRLKDNSKIKEYSNDKWLEKGLNKEAKTYNNFLLTEENLVIIFNPEIVAPFVAGIIQIEIPYETLNLIID